MAIYLFVFNSQPGRVERMVVSSPYVNAQGQPDPLTTWKWARTLQYPYPIQMMQQGAQQVAVMPAPRAIPLNIQQSTNPQQPDLLCVQLAEPAISQQNVISGMPVGMPTGNSGNMAPPPQAGPPAPQGSFNSGLYDVLPEAALPGSPDAMFGEGDNAGGTYTDITGSGMNAVETKRDPGLVIPAGNRPNPGQ
jgi:hypothetical protein